MAKVSVIIPSYNCKYVSRTVDNIFLNATGEIEVIVLLDNYVPNPPIKERENLTIIRKEVRTGMRNSINMGAAIASGKYLMKTDDHCSFSKGFDEALQIDIQNNWLVVPSRYFLDPEKWERRREAVEYEFMAYPYVYLDRHRYGIGLYAKKWLGENGINPENMGPKEFYYKENERKDIKIDDIMIFHGSCWFTSAEHFKNIEGLSETLFDTLYQEPQELSFKTWLIGGRVVINKHAWHAHMHKMNDSIPVDDPQSRGYHLDLNAMRRTERFGTVYWMNNCWKPAIYPMEWLIEKFWPIPGWPDDWKRCKEIFEKKYMRKELEICGIQY